MPRKIKLGLIDIGSFNINSNNVIISDISYDSPLKNNKHESSKLKNILNGSWKSFIRYADINTIATVFVVHSSFSDSENICDLKWTLGSPHIGRYSGKIAICDEKQFRCDDNLDHIISTDTKGYKWYVNCCNKVADHYSNSSVINGGVAFNACWTENDFKFYTSVNKSKKIIAIKIVLVEPEIDIKEKLVDKEYNILRNHNGEYIPDNDLHSHTEETVTLKLTGKNLARPKREFIPSNPFEHGVIREKNKYDKIDYVNTVNDLICENMNAVYREYLDNSNKENFIDDLDALTFETEKCNGPYIFDNNTDWVHSESEKDTFEPFIFDNITIAKSRIVNIHYDTAEIIQLEKPFTINFDTPNKKHVQTFQLKKQCKKPSKQKKAKK